MRPALFFLPLSLACSASHADNCDAIQAQVEAKIRASGVAQFTLTAMDQAASASGRVVGSCANGSRKIVYLAGAKGAAAPAAVPRKPAGEPILTECADGTVQLGGDCRK